MFSGITGMLQKQGNTEAVPVGTRSVVVTLNSYSQYIIIFNNSQYIKNIGIFIHNEKTSPIRLNTIFMILVRIWRGEDQNCGRTRISSHAIAL
jgi:hypothetical protein